MQSSIQKVQNSSNEYSCYENEQICLSELIKFNWKLHPKWPRVNQSACKTGSPITLHWMNKGTSTQQQNRVVSPVVAPESIMHLHSHAVQLFKGVMTAFSDWTQSCQSQTCFQWSPAGWMESDWTTSYLSCHQTSLQIIPRYRLLFVSILKYNLGN